MIDKGQRMVLSASKTIRFLLSNPLRTEACLRGRRFFKPRLAHFVDAQRRP
jgi:hypothetical protein